MNSFSTLRPPEGSRDSIITRRKTVLNVRSHHLLINNLIVLIYRSLFWWGPFWPHQEPFRLPDLPLGETNELKGNSSTASNGSLKQFVTTLVFLCCCFWWPWPQTEGQRSNVQTKQGCTSEGWPMQGVRGHTEQWSHVETWGARELIRPV